MADLLLELFSEEIPARMQQGALSYLSTSLQKHLSADAVQGFVTPRRVAVIIRNLPEKQPDVSTELKGPKVGAPEQAIQGFLKKTGLSLDQLEQRDGVYFAQTHTKGKATAEVLKDAIEKTLAEFPWPKSMRWGAGATAWVRPLHNILCIFDGQIVPVEFAGLKAGNTTYGHRFLAPAAITITSPDQYEAALEKAYVIADATKRSAKIAAQAQAAAKAAGCSLKEDAGLLAEVTGLVEWPVVLTGRIDDAFMDLPPEVLISEMRAHQKYFALLDAKGNLAPQFLITSNMETTDKGKAIIAGNERVLRARFADGRFFWDTDRKKSLADWAEGLKTVTYHAKLGTIADKVEHISNIAVNRLPDVAISIASYVDADALKVRKTAMLCKADLVTGMVGEFPELQGVMGRYYALAQGEAPEVADAIRDHYLPLGPDSVVPTEPTTICVALADKIDTLVGMFGINEKPTGSKDPYALRRAALGVIRIILENNIRIPLRDIFLYSAFRRFEPLPNEMNFEEIRTKFSPIADDLISFFTDRLKVQLKDQGVRHDLIAAVSALGEDDLVRLVARVNALQELLATEDGANLLAAYRRAANILKIEEKKDGKTYDAAINAAQLEQQEEKQLAEMLAKTLPHVKTALEQEDFTGAMKKIATLRAPVDAFFDQVKVNADAPEIRENRLRLLSQIRAALDEIANFALIEG